MHSRERSLMALRQTGTVSELAITFQNITNAFRPRWSDHPLIYVFSQKLKEAVRFELTARGSLPSTFQAYISAAISVELNQAAAASSRSNQPSYTPRPSFPLKTLSPPPPVRFNPLPPTPPWIWTAHEVPVAHLPWMSVAGGLTQGCARIAASRATSSPPVPTAFKFGVLFSSLLASSLPPTHSLVPGPRSPLLPLPPILSFLNPPPQPSQPRTPQKTPAPAVRGMAGRRPSSPPSSPLSYPLSSFPDCSLINSRSAPPYSFSFGRFWGVGYFPGSFRPYVA